ncbi:DUF3375 domain-containing protein [Actinomyces slackii]|uniref:Protein of uncharacterized function (DUF3375) n=1 Tax=Actinomyces slackii TaxID=52774 RepID=A0A448KAU8_9ACTO|nr:DUF3375 domain-containing protein [Actinomyces slackii]VEG74047.1 Protein of uncharacterised function (DUF3375) [Actinomyces slackii]
MPRTTGVVASALELHRLSTGPDADAGLRLLRLDRTHVAAAVLAAHLGGQVRRLPAADLHALIEEDLAALREAGVELGESVTARTYCDQWRSQGILVRTTMAGGREETYELSAPAEAALRYLAQVERPRPAVTQSRLTTIASQLDALVRDSDPSVEGRLAALRAQRDAIDAEIERVESGQTQPVGGAEGAERLAEILALAEQVPGDFSRVRAELIALNRSLRERIIEMPGSRGEVLDDVFRGVDRIESSEAGRSFLAFLELFQDPEASARLDDHLDEVLARPFVDLLPDADRRYLRHWRGTLSTESANVRQTMTGFSRSLRRFVQSRAFEEHRRLAEELARAQALAARAAATTSPIRRMSTALDLTGMSLGSIGSWRLHNPADARVAEEVVRHDVADLDLEAMREVVRASEIDLAELGESIEASLAARGVATIGEILADHPATQGLASVIGLLLLARERGAVLAVEPVDGADGVTATADREAAAPVECVAWVSEAGTHRSATIPRLLMSAADDTARR